ncbi:Fis family transcriptional regulator [Candidatus Magnetomorum sp. HK-1]|nr:Fis family transcriptional regulator [Candidatus Magnetomorum sp. HK-1]
MKKNSPQDEQTAIKIIPTLSINKIQKNENISQNSFFTIDKMNAVLEKMLKNPTLVISDCFMSVLKECFSFDYARLMYKKNDDDWIVLSEFCENNLSDEKSIETHQFSFMVPPNKKYTLEIKFSKSIQTASQNEFCRLILLVFTLCHQNQSSRQPIALDSLQVEKDLSDPWSELVGNQVKSHLAKYTDLCRSSETVLVIGKTGTGKELVAQSLHKLWSRPGEFVAINCAAIPADLLESELFGVVKGAATGVISRDGYFYKARQGTLFLDEISEMPISLQSKLLRVIQEREFFSVGSDQAQKADVKIVASTNQSPVLLLSGQMRPDLYFRLSQTVVTLPALKERSDDIASLCQFFLNKLENQLNRGVQGLSISALQYLKNYDWPGNVRELQHVLRYLYINAPQGGLIQSIHLPDEFQKEEDIPESGTLASIVKMVEKKVILRELNRFKNVGNVAKILGLSEGYLYRKIKQLGIKWKH